MIPFPDIPNPLDPIRDSIFGQIGDWVIGMIAAIVESFIGPAIASVTESLIAAMQATSQVDLTGDFGGLGGVRATILGLSLSMMLGIFFVNVFRATLTNQTGALVKNAFYELPRQALITALYLSFAQIAIVIVDGLSNQILEPVPDAIGRVGAVMALPAAGGANLLVVIFMILYILAAMFVWAELLIRSALIYIIAVLAPLGYALGVAPGGRDISRKTSMTLFSIILSKLGIAVAFRVGASLINNVGEGGEWSASDAMVGLTAMGLAAFMPFMILKAIPIMESATVAEGAERAPLRAAGTAAGVALGAMLAAGQIASLAGGGGGAAAGAGGGGGGQSPPPPTGGGSGSGSGARTGLSGQSAGGGQSELPRGPIVSGDGSGPPADLPSGSSGELPRGPHVMGMDGAGSRGTPPMREAPAIASSAGGATTVGDLRISSVGAGRYRAIDVASRPVIRLPASSGDGSGAAPAALGSGASLASTNGKAEQ